MSNTETAAQGDSLVRGYAAIGAIVVAVLAWLVVASWGAPEKARPDALIAPMVALFGLTAVVWLAMVVARHTAVMRGRASVEYYKGYQSDAPDERIERPARTFNNLMQVPTLFYVVCILMLVTNRADAAQVTLAWTFVGLRTVHAAVYIAVNWVPYRFAVWASSFVTLAVLWYRFAAHGPFG